MQDNNDSTPPNQDAPPSSGPDPVTPPSINAPEPSSSYGSGSFDSAKTSPETAPTMTELAAASIEKEVTGPTLDQNSLEAPVLPEPAVKSSKRKRWLIPVIIAGVLVLLGGTGAAAYNFWYQNPDKVLGDALVNTIRAKTVSFTGSFSLKTEESSSALFPSDLHLTVDGKNSNVEGEVNVKLDMTHDKKNISLSGSGLYDKDANLYFKLSNLQKTIDAYNTDGTLMPNAYKDIIAKIDNKWIKISVDDIKEFSEDYADTQVCLKSTLKKLENDKAVTKEIIDLYDKNRFIEVKEKLGSKEGSLGYRIETNAAKVTSFAKGINNTRLIKELQKCDDSFKLNDSDFEADSSTDNESSTTTNQFEAWVDRWSHQFTELTFTSKGDGYDSKSTVRPIFNKPVSVNVPKDFISLSELKKDIEAAASETYGGITDRANTSVAATNANQIIKKAEAYNAINGKYPTLNELKSAQDEAALNELQSIISVSEPTASTSSLVQYVLSGSTTGGYVAYYDTTTKSVKKIEFGVNSATLYN